MRKNINKILERVEEGAHHFLFCIKEEKDKTRAAAKYISMYMKGETLTKEQEYLIKQQMVDSLKLVGIVVPFVLLPGASLLMPILIKVAAKHNIELMPSSFNKKKA